MKQKQKPLIALLLFLLTVTFSGCNSPSAEIIKNDLRAPAYPLVTIDPYTSAWSMTDKLYDDNVKHWTGRDFPLLGVARIDGKTYRFMGVEKIPLKPIAAMSEINAWDGQYTLTEPGEGWQTLHYNAGKWQSAPAAFGTELDPTVKTEWLSKDIWVRREIDIKEDLSGKNLFIEFSHDDDFELYINGIEVANTGNSARKNVIIPMPEAVAETLKPGKNIMAAHCYNSGGEALVDFGIYEENEMQPLLTQTAVQQAVDVQATQTYYTFTCGEVELKLTFTAPLLMDDLNLMSRPVNYITYEVKSLDGKEHNVQLYFEAAPNWAVNSPVQPTVSEGYVKNNIFFLKTGNVEQNILGKRGDDIRIDWGYFFLGAENSENLTYAVNNDSYRMRNDFIKSGKLQGGVTTGQRSNVALTHELGNTKQTSGKILIGYDDIYSIQYFGDNLRPYWNKKGDKTIETAFAEALADYPSLMKKCTEFDAELMKSATKSGGKEYAELCALAYRQAISAHKLVETPNGDLLFLSKENFSNGSIGTVDITYPSAPLFLIYNVELAKGLMNQIFYYSESGKWNKPFPAHDVGTYPWANGQTYGDDMPVEESGNMLTLTAAIATIEGNTTYAEKHWDILTTWTDYLVEKGLDPENQLCTDDFAGHFAHNANLSVKAIMGIASYGYLANMAGKKDIADKYTTIAKEMAQEWMRMADDGTHYRLTFDQPGTWSQKYNLIWNKILKLNIFPDEVAQKEIAYYLTKQNEYGLPLDSRRNYTKADWIIWTATLADDDETFKQFISPLYKFMNETVDRVPMSDWYNTDSKTHVTFRARSVVGGYYMKMLADQLAE